MDVGGKKTDVTVGSRDVVDVDESTDDEACPLPLGVDPGRAAAD